MGCGFPTVCGVVAGPLSVCNTQRAGNRWKPLVSLAGRASCSCFVRLCVSEGSFVTSGLYGIQGVIVRGKRSAGDGAGPAALHAALSAGDPDPHRDQVTTDRVDRDCGVKRKPLF